MGHLSHRYEQDNPPDLGCGRCGFGPGAFHHNASEVDRHKQDLINRLSLILHGLQQPAPEDPILLDPLEAEFQDDINLTAELA